MAYVKSQGAAAIGGGIARAACAHALTLTTRRVERVDRHRHACATRLDHGAFGITAGSEAFQTLADQALHAGWLAQWAPKQPCRTQSLSATVPRRASDAAAASTAFAAHKTTHQAARRRVASPVSAFHLTTYPRSSK